MRFWSVLFTMAALSAPLTAVAEAPGIVVEMYTSKFCPNCPSAESKMTRIAAENQDLLVLFAHVDYWDRDDQKDPFGLPDVTQRQYDYSNRLSSRPGQVFTPMPILNGQWVAPAPLWLSWDKTLATARAARKPARLQLATTPKGALEVTLPKGANLKHRELTLMGLERIEDSAVWRVRALGQADVTGPVVTIPKALVPPQPRLLVLLQESGPGPVEAFGVTPAR